MAEITIDSGFNFRRGKSFRGIVLLLNNIRNGKDCVVATHTPEDFKFKFLHVTGVELKLKKRESCNTIYDATI